MASERNNRHMVGGVTHDTGADLRYSMRSETSRWVSGSEYVMGPLPRGLAKEIHMLAEIFGVDGVIVLIVVVVLLFGGAAIPKLARNLGSAKNEFEKGLENGKKPSALPTQTLSNGISAIPPMTPTSAELVGPLD